MKLSTQSWIVALVLASTVASFGSAQQETVTVWLEDGDIAQCTVDVLQAFDEINETANVKFILQANQWDVTRTSIAGGVGPDVVISPGPSFAFELAKAGLVLPLEDYAASLGWDERFVDWALSLGRVEGTLYSLPSELETLVLFYNKTLFEQNGWQVPKTMDELMSLSQTIADAGITPFAHANAEWRPANEWYVSAMLNHVAGPERVYQALTGTLPWTDPSFVEAITDLDTMQQRGWFSGGLENYYTALFDDTHAALGSGEAAMNLEGSWFLSDVNNFFGETAGNENTWDWAAFPSKSGEETYAIGVGSTYSINGVSQVPDSAAAFIDYLFQPETQAQLAVECGSAPSPTRINSALMDGLDPRAARLYSSITKASDAGNYGYLTWTFWPPKSDLYIYEEVERVWDGQLSAEDYLAGLEDTFKEELEEGDIPPIPER